MTSQTSATAATSAPSITSVPFIDLKRFEEGFLERWEERVRDITLNTRFVGGPDVAALEARLAEQAGVAGGVVGCANGTDAIQLALRASGVGEGDIVLIPDATFWATFEAVVNVGARPVTVDVDPDDLQMDYGLFAQAVETYKPRAVILVHLYGWASARLDDFRSFCRERDLPLIEDGAQSWGTTWKGASIYAGAYMSSVSFYPAKVLGACGDAGAVLCSTPELAETVRMLGNHGRTSHYGHGLVGWNSRMSGFDAAWLDLSLDYLDERLESRRRGADYYADRLASATAADGSAVRIIRAPFGYAENGYLNVIQVDPQLRPRLESALQKESIGYGNVYPGSMSEQPGADTHLVAAVGGDVAARLGQGVLNLPLFAHIREEELERVVQVVEAALRGA